MAKRIKPRGYSERAHREHPGVTISAEGDRIVLRWREVLPGGRSGRRRKQVVKSKAGSLIKSRTAAHPYAVAKSKELAQESSELKDMHDTAEANPAAAWDDLKRQHDAYLVRKGRSAKSVVAYRYSWSFVESWKSRPAMPKDLTLRDLESYCAHLRKRELSEGSQISILAHTRVILNFGRKRLKCVRLDPETINEGLEAPKGAIEPTVLDTAHLRTILKAAANWDADHPEAQTFPLLAFLMLTGARRGEAERLRWRPSDPRAKESWIDFTGDRLLIYGAKVKRQRTVPLGNRPVLKELLQALRDSTDAESLPYVFGGAFPLAIADKRPEATVVNVDGEQVRVKGRSLKRALAEVRRASGENWAIKDLRSTFATYMANTLYGSQLYRLAEENGHRPEVLIAKYAKHYALAKKQQQGRTVDGVLGIAAELRSWLAGLATGR